MTSISKKRPKRKSSGSSNSSLKSVFLWEPPDDLFPSKDDLFRLLTAVAIAVSVFLSCSFFFSARQPKPFCDSASDSSDFLSGGSFFSFSENQGKLQKIQIFSPLVILGSDYLWFCLTCSVLSKCYFVYYL